MVIENDPSARIQVRSRGELMHPAKCMVCGTSDSEREYIDLAVYYDYEGTQYLCSVCVTQAAEILGMFTPEEVKQIIAYGEEQTAKVAELTSELEDARPAIDYLRRFSPSSHLSGSILDMPGAEISEPEPERSLKLVDGSGDGEPSPEESTKSTGSTDTKRSKHSDVTFT